MRSLKEIRNYLEGGRKAQANIPRRDRKTDLAVLATNNAYAALRQSLTTEQFLEALKREPFVHTEKEVVREYQMQVQIIIDYAEENAIEEFIKKHHLTLGYAVRDTSGDKGDQECWSVTIRRKDTATGFEKRTGFSVYAERGTTVDLVYSMTWLGKYLADKAPDHWDVGYMRVLVGTDGIQELIELAKGK